ncbi:MAG: S8 family serine peptidase [Flavobacteriales bacterium]|jgi:PKD repeat protein|nr:S8 family serine peptidase [Flavobacteriales bacterium]
MKNTYLIFVVLLQLGAYYAQNNQVYFKRGTVTFEENGQRFMAKKDVAKEEVFAQRFYKFVQFYSIPTQKEIQELKQKGVRLLSYIPSNTYIASFPVKINLNDLKTQNIRSIQTINVVDKVEESIALENYPSWAIQGDVVELVIKTYPDIELDDLKEELLGFGVKCTGEMIANKAVIGKVHRSMVKDLARLGCVQYLETVQELGEPESNDGRNLHRSNAIDVDFLGGRKYNGEGVSVAINDDGFVGPHIDFTGRTNQLDVLGDLTGTHGDMTTGIIGGAGNLDPLMKGMATGAYIHVRQYSSAMGGTIPLYLDSNVLVFSSSYSNGCNGGYTATTELVDKEIFDNYALMQVFSGGNSNNNDCGYGAGTSWGNITGGHKIGKNVIAVANLEADDNIRASSSRGPASDGRIKPDIAAHGAGHMSTDPNNTYAAGGGTSAAAPGVAGVMAQLHHAYRVLNGNVAHSGLLKAAMLVTANDLGNEGPDFIYGWGKVNGLKALKLIEENRFFNGSISQGATINHSITIPNNIKRARVMVYWVDKEASTTASQALVNDLDCAVTDPSGGSHLPWVLDHTPNPSLLALPATRGVDHLNNMEEIEIVNPLAGNYTLSINGTTIPFGTQDYFVVYEFIEDAIDVIYPIGGEGLIPNTLERIHWDADGTMGSFLVEYTEDNGLTWNTIQSNVSGSSRFINWTVPNTLTGQAKVRVSRGGNVGESIQNFTIMNRPDNLSIDRICYSSNTIEVSWDAVVGATSYDVYLLGNKYMDSVGNTATLTYSIPVFDVNQSHWVSVRARGNNGAVSLRQIAIEQVGASQGGCLLSCTSDHDIGVKSILYPTEEMHICEDSLSVSVQIEVENSGLHNENNFQLNYQYGNQPVVSMNYTNNLAVGSVSTVTFPAFYISTSSTQNLKVWTTLNTDSTFCNDTSAIAIQISNASANLPYSEDFESGLFPSANFSISNFDGDKTWESIEVTGANGQNTNAAYVNNYSYNNRGERDALKLPVLDLTSFNTNNIVNLTFDVAYRTYSPSYFDSLIVEVSSDCGITYTPLYLKSGSTLSTGGSSTSSWEPTNAGDWRAEQVNLSAYIGGKVFVRFINSCDYGQNLYLDNINITVVGPPVADFAYLSVNSCAKEVLFQDHSISSPTQWFWDFGDGNTSTMQHPSHNYASTGSYTVTLNSTNSFGTGTYSQTIVIDESISNFPLKEDFEENTNHSFLSRIINTDNNITWDSTNVVGSDGQLTSAVKVNNYAYNNQGEEDVLEFYDFNFSSLQHLDSAVLYFDVAYRQYSNAYSDSIKVLLSTDCGQSFSTVYYKGGTAIANGSAVTSSGWEPQVATDWITDSVLLTTHSADTLIVRIVNITGYGQQLFLDNINVKAYGGYTAIEEPLLGSFNFMLVPNPAQNQAKIIFNERLKTAAEVRIYSTEGRLIFNETMSKGEEIKSIALDQLSPAVYYVQIDNENNRRIKKLIVQ